MAAPRSQGPGGARPTASPQAIQAPNFGQISPLAADLANEGGYARAYGNFLQRPTADFTQGAFGPFSPILPVPVNQPPEGGERPEPRRFQYPVGWNLPAGEPGMEGIKLASFSTLRTLADLYSVARACIELRKKEIRGLNWDITPTPEAAKAYQGSPSQRDDFGKRRAEVIKFFRHPDPNYFSWTDWIDSLLEEIFVYDALSILIRPKWGKGMKKGLLGSDLDSLELIHGPTIRPLLDINGGTPRPPAPAYQQYLYGVPRADLMTMITQRDIDDGGIRGSELNRFRGDQLLYLRMTPRVWTPYGFPPIEQAMIPVRSGLNKQAYQLQYFTEGTVPAVFISPGDANMTPNQIRELQDALNAIAGDPAWKHKIIVLPPGSHIDPMHQAQLADQFDEIVMSQVCMAFNVSPMELGISPKVSTTQSPGAANQMAKMAQNTKDRVATKPLLSFLSDVFEGILYRVCGQDDMQFMFEGLEEEEDQEQLTSMLIQQATNGLRSIDECREELHLQPWGLPETGEPVMLTPTGPVPFQAASQQASAQAAAGIAGSNAAESAFRSGASAPPGTSPTVEQQQQMQDQKNQGQTALQDKKNENAQQLQQSQHEHASAMAQQIAAGQAGQTPAHSAAAAGVHSTSSAKPSTAASVKPSGTAATASAGPAKSKAAVAELQALARHLKKGRYIGSWEPVSISGTVLEIIAEDLAKGLTPDEAITGALVTLPGEALVKADDAGPKAATPGLRSQSQAGRAGWSSSGRPLEKIGPKGYTHGWHFAGSEADEPLSGSDAWDELKRQAQQHFSAQAEAGASFYSGPGSVGINRHLRGTEGYKASEGDLRAIDGLNAAFHEAEPLKRPMIVHRGVGMVNPEEMFGKPGSRIGSVFSDRGFASTTTDPQFAFLAGASGRGRGFNATIRIPAGTRVVAPSVISGNDSKMYEHEALLPAGSRFKITGDGIVNGQRHLDLELVM